MNNALNILKTYSLYYLASFPEFVKQLSDVFWEKVSPETLEQQLHFFAMQPVFNQYQYKLLYEFFKIELYINTWHSKTITDIFQTPKKDLSLTKLDKNHFLKLLESYEQLCEEFYSQLADVVKTEEKFLPFTLDDKASDKSEKLKFLSSILSH